jgi:hypothetical protein
VKVEVMISRNVYDFAGLPRELVQFNGTWSELINHSATTDADGRFRVEGMLPGLKYNMAAAVADDQILMHREKMVFSAGEVRDLGTK